MARYAFQYPQFFFDHWGKPLFTLLAAPFAQFGYNGVKVFNVFMALLAAFFTYKVSRIKLSSSAIMAIAFVLLSPVFFGLIPGSMTEITGAAVLAASLYLFYRKHYIGAAVLIGLLPFARLEGALITACFGLALLYHKQWKAIPALFIGLIGMSLLGWPFYNDLFWVYTHLPYSSASAALYGRGSLWYYVENTKSIIGIPAAIFLVIGLIHTLLMAIWGAKDKKREELDFFVLVILPAFLVVAFHSITWYLGIGALALTRFMVLIVPLFALIAVRGYGVFEKYVSFQKTPAMFALRLFLIALLISTALSFYPMPVKPDASVKVLKEACDWIKKEGLSERKVFYYDPYVFHFLNKNPFDETQAREKVYNFKDPGENLNPGELVVWDAGLAPGNGNMPLDRLIKNTDFKVLKVFRPQYNFEIFGNPYEVYVFERVEYPEKANQLIDN